MTSIYNDADRYADFNPDTLVPVNNGPQAAQLPAADADQQVWVTTSFRLRQDQHKRVKDLARAHGVDVSTLLREWIDLQLVAESNDEPISRSDVLRAVAALLPVRRTA